MRYSLRLAVPDAGRPSRLPRVPAFRLSNTAAFRLWHAGAFRLPDTVFSGPLPPAVRRERGGGRGRPGAKGANTNDPP